MAGKLSKGFVNYFFKGLLLLAPVTITVWAATVVFEFIDGLLKGLLTKLLGVEIPGIGLVALVVLITGIGVLGSSIILRPFLTYFDGLLAKAPLIKIVYTAVKDLVSAFVGQKKRFNEPVLVRLSKETELQKIGFITNRDLSLIGLSGEKVAVYLPHSYAWSGNLFIVPTDYVTLIDASPTEVMKFIISAGVTNLTEGGKLNNQTEEDSENE